MLRVLGRGALRMIAMGAETREVHTGEMLFAPQREAGLRLRRAGRHCSRSASIRKIRQRVIEAGPGTMLGEFALLTDTARPLSAIAQQPSTVMRISRSMFLKILEDDADAAVRLRDYVARRTRQSVADVLVMQGRLRSERA